jgi:hypothetical protein
MYGSTELLKVGKRGELNDATPLRYIRDPPKTLEGDMREIGRSEDGTRIVLHRSALEKRRKLKIPERAAELLENMKNDKVGGKIEDDAIRNRREQDQEWLQKACGPQLATLRPSDVQVDHTPTLNVKAELICSYNCNNEEKTLYVPGAPARWSAPKMPLTLPPRIINFEPSYTKDTISTHIWRAFEALQITQPSYDFANVDVVCEYTSLVKLLELVGERRDSAAWGAMRLDTRVVNKTLFLHVREPGNSTRLQRHDCENLKKAGSKIDYPQLEGTEHYRWHQYNIGPTRFAVLVEVPASKATAWKGRSSGVSARPGTFDPELNVIEIGQPKPFDELLLMQIVTKSLGPSARLPSFFFSRVRHQVDGFFTRKDGPCQIRRVSEQAMRNLHTWNVRQNLPILTGLLGQLQQVTLASESKACITIAYREHSNGPSRFDVYEPEFDQRTLSVRRVPDYYRLNPDFLPDDVVDRFWRSNKSRTSRRKEPTSSTGRKSNEAV